MNQSCTRRLEFDAAHRVMRHESKCRNLHGHRYVVEITASGKLDTVGRVIDFGVLKETVGGWIDEHWDHGLIVNHKDTELIELCTNAGWKVYVLQTEPTAECMAPYLLSQSNTLLRGTSIVVTHIRLYETPNCWADYDISDFEKRRYERPKGA